MNHSQKRHRARRLAIQAIYQWSYDGIQSGALIEQFVQDNDMREADFVYFEDLVKGTIQHVVMIDELMSAHLDRDIHQLDLVELAILRLSIYELLHRKDIPYKVVINEALKLTKEFGATDGHKFVNAILDALMPEVRRDEVQK